VRCLAGLLPAKSRLRGPAASRLAETHGCHPEGASILSRWAMPGCRQTLGRPGLYYQSVAYSPEREPLNITPLTAK
jgi:hypothetical protein